MTILVCPLSKVGSVIATRSPERIVSSLDPDVPSPYVGFEYVSRHLRLSFHDVDIATWDEEIATPRDVRELLAFSALQRRQDGAGTNSTNQSRD